jgi:hypothetical protein
VPDGLLIAFHPSQRDDISHCSIDIVGLLPILCASERPHIEHRYAGRPSFGCVSYYPTPLKSLSYAGPPRCYWCLKQYDDTRQMRLRHCGLHTLLSPTDEVQRVIYSYRNSPVILLPFYVWLITECDQVSKECIPLIASTDGGFTRQQVLLMIRPADSKSALALSLRYETMQRDLCHMSTRNARSFTSRIILVSSTLCGYMG